MRICLPIQPQPEGGAHTFIHNFRRYVEAQQIPFTDRLSDPYDILLVNSWMMDYERVRAEKKSKPAIRVVHRIDGSAVDYGRRDDADLRQARVNLLADLTIFQSHYSRLSTTKKFRVIAHDGPIIHNPVDTELFAPHGERHPLPETGRPRVVNVCWSTNRMKGTWQIPEFARKYHDVDFVLCGRYDFTCDAENVFILGHLKADALARVLRSCDVFMNLSENDPCPNVVLEALASGLPVLYKDSGGVPELVGPAGQPTSLHGFREDLQQVLDHRESLAATARQRAQSLYSTNVIFPKYLAAMHQVTRQPLPSPLVYWRMHAAGYPVLDTRLTDRLKRTVPGALRRLKGVVLSAQNLLESKRGMLHPCERDLMPKWVGEKPYRIGWISPGFFATPRRHFGELQGFERMRVENVARWVNRSSGLFHNEFYRPERHYHAVIFQKMMDDRSREEARRIQGYGGKVIFDANVNYYEIWGEYIVPGTQPTPRQQEDAEEMTRNADWVVADSEYLAATIQKQTPKVTFIPDNVDLNLFSGIRTHTARKPCVLMWSGIGKKAMHLLLIRDVLARLKNVELRLVTDWIPADILGALQEVVPCEVLFFSDKVYAGALLDSDIIISPKRLTNGYELAHTEYKISPGMAVGLPAVASPQPSYVEAISHKEGGLIAHTDDDWYEALHSLSQDHNLRAQMGISARDTIVQLYSTPIIARKYLDLFEALLSASSESQESLLTTPPEPNRS